jgi:hypothetical protein
MKRILSGLMILALLLCAVLPAFAEESDGLIYIYGGVSNKNRAKLKTMGQQSWYMMYSTQLNVGEDIDLSTFKECIQNETGMWKPAEETQLPNTDPSSEGEMVTYSGDWFSIRKDGLLAPDTGYSAALKWVCEQDGTYDLSISYSGGSSGGYPTEGYTDATGGYWVPAADGVYMSAWMKRAGHDAAEKLVFEDSWTYDSKSIPQTDITVSGVEFKAGDEIWIVSDPKLNGGWDSPWWCFIITEVK